MFILFAKLIYNTGYMKYLMHEGSPASHATVSKPFPDPAWVRHQPVRANVSCNYFYCTTCTVGHSFSADDRHCRVHVLARTAGRFLISNVFVTNLLRTLSQCTKIRRCMFYVHTRIFANEGSRSITVDYNN